MLSLLSLKGEVEVSPQTVRITYGTVHAPPRRHATAPP